MTRALPTTLAAALLAASLTACGGGDSADQPVAAPSTTPATTSAAPPPTTPAMSYPTPLPGSFTLTPKILKKQCFGSAGCNIEFRIEVSYAGLPLDPSKTYEVTYEVKGGEDPLINTFELTGTSASVQETESISTERKTDKLTATVTSVSDM
ncbi:hypothetical protein ACIBCR_16300 [Micromonospora echinospora]|uniref:hypothetical protein n=1 Tax=Micromonospora echinospora TaxID=1877 RepID=UPI0037B67A27